MFQYGIDTSSLIAWIVFAVVFGTPTMFIMRCAFIDDLLDTNKSKVVKSTIVFFVIVIMFGAGFCSSQKEYCTEQSVKEVLNENYPGFTDFRNKNHTYDRENSFVYKKAKYTWEYDKSNEKLIVTYYGVPHEDAVFINGKKQEKSTK